jgi:acyl-homoserine lactone acylase PvdQ
LDALDNYYFVPQADPNTSSQTQRLMKVLALKQLVASNPALYDPIAVDTAALQALGWSNPQQFMIPPSAQGKPPPELMQAMAKMQIDKSNADARMMDSQTRAQDAQARIELDHMRLQMESSRDQGDPAKMAQVQTQQMEIQQRNQDTMFDAINRKRDRESRERLAAIKLAEEVMRNPDGLATAQQFIDPQMLQRLEGNEPTLDGTKTGEL